MKIESTVIFGTEAVNHYEETGKVPSVKWLKQHGGVVTKQKFNSKAEYDAYQQGIADGEDWNAREIVRPTITETPDCSNCQDWRSYFNGKYSKTYCPNCGKQIISLTEGDYETVEFNKKQYPVRTINFPGHYLDGSLVGTEALNILLMHDDHRMYVSEEAEQVDITIVFYVMEEILGNFSDAELAFYIDANM